MHIQTPAIIHYLAVMNKALNKQPINVHLSVFVTFWLNDSGGLPGTYVSLLSSDLKGKNGN